MLHFVRNPYAPRHNDSGASLWIGIALLMILIVGGFMLVGPRGSDTGVIASHRSE